MKVTFGQVLTFICVHLFLLITTTTTTTKADYATGSSVRKQPMPETAKKQETLKFGAKILKPVNDDVNKYQTTTRSAANSSSTINDKYVARSSSRYNIPVVYKNHTVSAVQNKPRSSAAIKAPLKPTRSSEFATSRFMKAGRSSSRLNATARSTTTTTTSTTTTTTTTSTTTTTTTARPNPLFAFGNAFNLFNLFSLSNPPPEPSTTKKPPKKYIPSFQSTKEKSNPKPLNSVMKTPNPKEVIITPKPTYFTTTAPKIFKTTTSKEITEGPFRIALPTHNFSGVAPKKNVLINEKDKEKRAIDETAGLRSRFTCPRENEVRFQLFPKDCKNDKDCTVWNREEICCEIFGVKSCVNGIPKPLKEPDHEPILGVIQRKCPARPLAELWWEVQECETDKDCWPRVCCPDGRRRYCRTSQPELETAPVQVKRSFNYLTEYLECTAPPPLIFDLHPKACTSTLDCFPNVCCQESGRRHCRPPKKSLLTWMANFLNVDFVKKFTQNIVIK